VAAGQASGSGVSRVAVVTGGGSGMGRAICHRLVADGHRVAALDVNLAAADAAHDILEDAEGNDDAYRRRCLRLGVAGEHQAEGRKAAATAHDHGMSHHPSAIAKRAAP